jgi:hypothetical protein
MMPDVSWRWHIDRHVNGRRYNGSSEGGLQALGVIDPIL